MAKEKSPEELAAIEEKKRLAEEKKQLKKEQAEAKKQAKKRAKEIAKQEEELDEERESNGIITLLATLFIVVLWLAVVIVIIKLDVGGFGSKVLSPVLSDVPVVNLILPGGGTTITNDPERFGGYSSLQEAVDQIYALELQLEQEQLSNKAKDEQLEALRTEVNRLSEFEEKQVEFQRIRTEFYEEVIYAENGPGAEEYRKYYQEMDPATAEYLYKQVVTELEEDAQIQSYAESYASSAMKPKQAAAIFEAMNDSEGLKLAAKILKAMSVDDRGKILGAMNSEAAAKLTKIMDPDS